MEEQSGYVKNTLGRDLHPKLNNHEDNACKYCYSDPFFPHGKFAALYLIKDVYLQGLVL